MKKFAVAFGGESLIKEYDLYGYRRGVHEKVCYHLRWGKFYKRLNWYAYPAGASFCADKRMQKRFRAAP